MDLLSRLALATALAFGVGCVNEDSFKQCTKDEDCNASDAGTSYYCTTDNICVGALPLERLCDWDLMAGVKTPVPHSLDRLAVISLVDRNDSVDRDVEQAVKLAVDEINRLQNGAGQPEIELHACHTAGDPEQTLRAAQYAYQQFGMSAIVGPGTSGGLVNINDFVRENGILVISAEATAVNVTSLRDSNLVWRTIPSDALQAKLLVERVRLGMPPPAVVYTVYVDSVYGKGLSDAFADAYSPMTVKDRIRITSNDDIPGVIDRLASDGTLTDAILVADDGPRAAAILKEIDRQVAMNRLTTTRFFMSDAARANEVLGAGLSSGLLMRVHGTAPGSPRGLTYDNFRSAFRAVYMHDPGTFTANAYDATYLVAISAAATMGKVPKGTDLLVGMLRLRNLGMSVPVGSANYNEAVRQMGLGGVYLEGASGLLLFDTNGDPTEGTFEYWGINTSGPMPVFETQ